MINDIIRRLRGAPESAAALAEAIREAEAGLPAIENALATAEAERAGLLLTGSDAEVLRAEGAMTAARLKRDRLNAAIGELRRRHDEAVTSEAEQAYQARRTAAQAASDATISKVRGRIRELLAEAGALAGDIAATERLVEGFNSAAIGLGRSDFVPRPSEVLVDEPVGWLQRAAAL